MNKKLSLLLFVLLGCALYCANEQWFIYDIDDYAFSTVTAGVANADGTTSMSHERPVDSLADAVTSQATCYKLYNGRFLIHGMVQWLCGTQPAWVVVLLNTLAWGLLIASMALLCCCGMRLTWTRMLISLSALWLLMPGATYMFMGSVTGAADYLWSGAMTLLFLWAFYRCESPATGVRVLVSVMLTLLALVAGAMQESFSIGVSAGLVVYAIVRKLHMPARQWAMIVAYLLGTTLIVFAPANFLRADMMGHSLHPEVLIAVAKYPVFDLMVLAMVVAWFVNRQVVKDVISGNLVIAVALVVNLLFAMCVAFTGPWQLTSVALCSMVLLLQVLYRLFINSRWFLVTLAVPLMAGTVWIASVQYRYRSHMWNIQREMFSQALTSGDGLVSLHKAFDFNRAYESSWLAPVYRQYTRNFARALINDDQECGNSMMSKFLTNCANPALVKALLPATPQRIERFFNSSSMRVDGIKAVRCEDYIIVRDNMIERSPAVEPCQEYAFNGLNYYVYIASELAL